MKLMVLALICIAFVIGFYFGLNYQSSKNTGLYVSPLACSYNGNVYKNGDSFKSNDGCNSCSCDKGQISCTEMACLTN